MTNWFAYRQKKAKSNLERAFANPRGFVATHGHGVTDTLNDFFVAVAQRNPPRKNGKRLSDITGLGADNVAKIVQQHQDQCESQPDGLARDQSFRDVPQISELSLQVINHRGTAADSLAHPQDNQALHLSVSQHMLAHATAHQTPQTTG